MGFCGKPAVGPEADSVVGGRALPTCVSHYKTTAPQVQVWTRLTPEEEHENPVLGSSPPSECAQVVGQRVLRAPRDSGVWCCATHTRVSPGTELACVRRVRLSRVGAPTVRARPARVLAGSVARIH